MSPSPKHCARPDGSLRAWFRSKADAEAFAADPKNWPVYRGDIAHKCHLCGFFHLSRPEWLVPEWLDVDSETAVIN